MNYRHIYHAGNICDVVKHAVLSLIIDHLRMKEAPFCVIDTHAGIGFYDLQDPNAEKTGEAKDGILKFLDAKRLPELESYTSVLQKMNLGWNGQTSEGFRYYPGSPLLTIHMLRPQDRLVACELHPEDAAELKRQLFPYKQAQTHHRDGYEALGAFLPPPEKRGLVLIDPPFEVVDEFGYLTKMIKSAHDRWPQGTYLLWYPIKDRPAIWSFHEALIATGIPKILAAEFIYRPETDHERLNGSGMILINPPWQIDDRIKQVFAALHSSLQTEHNQDHFVWLSQT